MTISIDKSNLYSIFNVTTFEGLSDSINQLSPSMVEYYLNNIASLAVETLYLNKTNVQLTLHIDNYTLYMDYSDNIYMEITQNTSDELITESLW